MLKEHAARHPALSRHLPVDPAACGQLVLEVSGGYGLEAATPTALHAQR
jgi:hypothetical protein